MFGDLQHSLARYVSTPQDIFEEGNYVVQPFRPTE
jgi:hypothetical protein